MPVDRKVSDGNCILTASPTSRSSCPAWDRCYDVAVVGIDIGADAVAVIAGAVAVAAAVAVGAVVASFGIRSITRFTRVQRGWVRFAEEGAHTTIPHGRPLHMARGTMASP